MPSTYSTTKTSSAGKLSKKCRQWPARIVQTLNREKKFLGDRSHWRGFPVRQELLQGRTAHEVRCVPPDPSLAAALLDGLFEPPADAAETARDVHKPC
jgi:hypothetical protein